MAEGFLHGVEVIEIDNGPRPIRTVRSGVIGLIGTAPEADALAYPLDTPVLISGSRREAAKLGTKGSLPGAIDGIFDQVGAVVVVVRVDEGSGDGDERLKATLSNVIGGVDPQTGAYLGVQAFRAAKSIVKVTPKILIAPGFTHQRLKNEPAPVEGEQTLRFSAAESTFHLLGKTLEGVVVTSTDGTATYQLTSDYTVDAAAGTVTRVPDGAIPEDGEVRITYTYTPAPESPFSNPVVAELKGIAESLRAVIIADGPNTNDADAISYREDWGTGRIYVVDPWCKVMKDGEVVSEPASARVAGLLAKIDNDRGFWWSPSNQEINGIGGTHRAVDFELGDANCRANLLNEQCVSTIIHEDGYRLWGNRTCSSDPKWAFLSVRRTADMLNESILQAHLWAVDRNIDKTYVEDVTEGVNAYLRELKAKGAILGGACWPDPDLNTAAAVSDGHVYFNFDFTPPYPAERVIFQSHLVDDYIEEIFR